MTGSYFYEVNHMSQKFHENLRFFRKNKHLQQKTMADALGIQPSTYSGYESGKREPNFETLKRIALFLGISTDELLGLDPAASDEQLTEDERLELHSYAQYLIYRRK